MAILNKWRYAEMNPKSLYLTFGVHFILIPLQTLYKHPKLNAKHLTAIM